MYSQRAGTAKPSFAATMLDEVPDGQPLSASEEREMSGAAGVVYSGEKLVPIPPSYSERH